MSGDVEVTHVIDYDVLEAALPELARSYRTAQPFPHVVIDDLLGADVLEAVLDEFDAVDDEAWRKYLHVNERKYANIDPSTWGPTQQAVLEELGSDRFVAFLERLSGYEGLIADLTLDGGGLHRSLPGGYLNVHTDFTAHHVHHHWRRRLNLILYLNRDWDPAWGGDLELWSPDMEACVERVLPVANRALFFSTSQESYHGHPDPLACPPERARQSLALYYFTEEPELVVRSTDYRARPGDGMKSAAIWLDKQVLRAYDVVKRRLRLSDESASRWLGALDRLRRPFAGRRGRRR